MFKKGTVSYFSRISMFLLFCTALIVGCSDDITPEPEQQPVQELTASTCGCTYTVPVNSSYVAVDGNALKLKPGNVVCLQGGKTYGTVVLKNFVGSASAPITVMNCGGVVNIYTTGGSGLEVQSSQYVRITGGTGSARDIRVNGGQISVAIGVKSTDIEMDHVEVYNSKYAGVMAKTDPSCTNNADRAHFVMKNIWLHDNYVHDTRSEGFYVGHSYWVSGVTLDCGVKMPHEMEGVKVYNNVIKNSGAESIQIGSAPKGAEVYGNRIENYGTYNESGQNNGIQFGQGANGTCYGNFIKGGKGMGIILISNNSNVIHDNVLVNTGNDGIFIDDRMAGPGFKILNNTIIRPGGNGITLYSDEVTMNTVQNNIIVAPGSYSKMKSPRTTADSYIYKMFSAVKLTSSNNYTTQDINALKFKNATNDDYSLTSSSTVAINKGALLSGLTIPFDFLLKPRIIGLVDIGAYEYQ
ncbi:MAG TPA: right-handed parallel beta-helix repeat-containing protein [Cyclobacteriaceae bacterium]|nr:right-handed parallel beta-helix repeat-containing protein [Cyclobacteriaceae bacterium]